MHVEKYRQLRDKIKTRSYEKRYKTLNFWLYLASFGGNIGSVFFAFFLIYPSFKQTFSSFIGDNVFSHLISGFISVSFLAVFELIKRSQFRIFSEDFVRNSHTVAEKSQILEAVICVALISASFYFSLHGAMDFSKISETKNVAIEAQSKTDIDSLKQNNLLQRIPYQEEIDALRKSNKDLITKRDNTPLNERRARSQYDDLIAGNEKRIENNLSKISDLEKRLEQDIKVYRQASSEVMAENKSDDGKLVFLFLSISTIIELAIILGVYFREYYDYRSFKETEPLMEPVMIKRDKYLFLLKIVFKNGDVRQEEQVLSVNKLTEMVRNKASQYPPKLIGEFFNELTHLGVFKVASNKRYTVISYEEAKKLVDSIDTI